MEVRHLHLDVQKCALLPRGERGMVSEGIEIQFVNNARVTVSQVTFAVVYHGKSAVIPDHGSFTPGTVISRRISGQDNACWAISRSAAAISVSRNST